MLLCARFISPFCNESARPNQRAMMTHVYHLMFDDIIYYLALSKEHGDKRRKEISLSWTVIIIPLNKMHIR